MSAKKTKCLNNIIMQIVESIWNYRVFVKNSCPFSEAGTVRIYVIQAEPARFIPAAK